MLQLRVQDVKNLLEDMENIQFLGYVLSLSAVGPILPPSN